MPGMNRAQPLQVRVGLLPLPRPLMTGEVLDGAFRLFRAGLLRCLPYSGLAVLVLELPTLYSTFLNPALYGKSSDVFFVIPHTRIVTYLIVFCLITLLLGVITLRLQAVARGIKSGFRAEVGTALRRWLPALIATAGGIGLPLLLFAGGNLLGSVFYSEAALVLALPILWPTALLVATLPAFWCESRGPFAAIARSVSLSRRRSWRMAGTVLATGCMVAVFYVLTAIVGAILSTLLGRADLFLIATVSSLLSLVIGAFGVPFVLAVLIVAYEDLALRDSERHRAAA